MVVKNASVVKIKQKNRATLNEIFYNVFKMQ